MMLKVISKDEITEIRCAVVQQSGYSRVKLKTNQRALQCKLVVINILLGAQWQKYAIQIHIKQSMIYESKNRMLVL